MKAIKHEVHEDKKYNSKYFSVLIKDKDIEVWVDVEVDAKFKDLDIDWNKWQFNLRDAEDVKIKQYQNSLDNCDACFSLATSYLEEQNLIYQSNKGNWFLYPSKEEITDEMNLHNEDEVGIDNQWNFEDAEYHLLLSDKYY
jgi:hypothetical protein